MLDSLKGSNMRDVYIVTGSEDGLIGVYSSLKKAKERALQYVTQDGNREGSMSHEYSDYYNWFFEADESSTTASITREEVQ